VPATNQPAQLRLVQRKVAGNCLAAACVFVRRLNLLTASGLFGHSVGGKRTGHWRAADDGQELGVLPPLVLAAFRLPRSSRGKKCGQIRPHDRGRDEQVADHDAEMVAGRVQLAVRSPDSPSCLSAMLGNADSGLKSVEVTVEFAPVCLDKRGDGSKFRSEANCLRVTVVVVVTSHTQQLTDPDRARGGTARTRPTVQQRHRHNAFHITTDRADPPHPRLHEARLELARSTRPRGCPPRLTDRRPSATQQSCLTHLWHRQ
jgi:hypothetical protein